MASRPSAYSRTAPVIAMAASAGGLAALSCILMALPAELDATILVVQHLDPKRESLLPEILGRRTALRVRQAQQHDRLHSGTVFVAPAAFHLLVNRNATLTLSQIPPVHFVRPSADRLFESAGRWFGSRAVAVVLTGTGRDGVDGARRLKRYGGTVLVQDEPSSQFFGMPGAAIDAGLADRILPLDQIANALIALAGVRGAAE